MTAFEEILKMVLFASCIGAVIYYALKLQKIRVQNEIKTIKMEKEKIVDQVNGMSLSDLVDTNNKSESSGANSSPKDPSDKS